MKKISSSTVKAFLKENKRENIFVKMFYIGEESFDVTVRTVLTLDEKSVFVNRVISGCFDMYSKFRPEYFGPMFHATIIQMCTNLPPLTLKKEKDDNGVAVLDLNGMDELYHSMNLDSLENKDYQIMKDEMYELCNQAVDWRKGNLIASLSNALSAISKKIDEVDTNQLLEYAMNLSNATKNMDENGLVKKIIELSDYKNETGV